ncbi:unnamed protein product [Closterium sp. NIES-65]|nr:unnamed protein product [Closterium sp. NIES-65]
MEGSAARLSVQEQQGGEAAQAGARSLQQAEEEARRQVDPSVFLILLNCASPGVPEEQTGSAGGGGNAPTGSEGAQGPQARPRSQMGGPVGYQRSALWQGTEDEAMMQRWKYT